jgi:hypothetical protein
MFAFIALIVVSDPNFPEPRGKTVQILIFLYPSCTVVCRRFMFLLDSLYRVDLLI